jgi:hypothetical protein
MSKDVLAFPLLPMNGIHKCFLSAVSMILNFSTVALFFVDFLFLSTNDSSILRGSVGEL